MTFLTMSRTSHPRDDAPKTPPPPAREPEPDVPDPDDELRDLVRPVKS